MHQQIQALRGTFAQGRGDRDTIHTITAIFQNRDLVRQGESAASTEEREVERLRDKIFFSFSLDAARVLGYIARVNKSVSHRPAATGYTGPAAIREHAKVVTAPQAGNGLCTIESRGSGVFFGELSNLDQNVGGYVEGVRRRNVQSSGQYPDERSESEEAVGS